MNDEGITAITLTTDDGSVTVSPEQFDRYAASLTTHQREILEWLADRWELLRWRCNDRRQRWHMGEMEVDGRAVRGLRARGLVVPGGTYAGGQLVLTDRGREAVHPAQAHGSEGRT